MGDINQSHYLKKFYPAINGPVIEIGSKDYGSTQNFRSVYTGYEYVGVDLEAGKGVDVVCDLSKGTGDLPTNHFALGICCSVMEHVPQPWIMAQHMTTLMRPGGVLYLSVPWVWRYHPYPDDYFRFSWRGIEAIFPEFDWQHLYYSTYIPGEFIEIKRDAPGVDNMMALMKDTANGKRKYLPYLMINMLGTKCYPINEPPPSHAAIRP